MSITYDGPDVAGSRTDGVTTDFRSARQLTASLVVPFSYFFRSRVPTAQQKLGWVMAYLVPVLGLAAAARGSPSGLTPAMLMVVAIYAAYEFGYLVNDTLTVRRESAPTLRLTPQASAWIEARLGRALLARAALGGAALLLLLWFDATHAVLATLGWFAIWPLFALYNVARGRRGIIVYLLLVGLRFTLPVLVVAHPEGAAPAWPLLCLLFAVPTTFEAAWKPRYRLAWLRSPFRDAARFRVLWYLLLTAGSALAAWIADRRELWVLAAASTYYLMLRLSAVSMRRFAFVSPRGMPRSRLRASAGTPSKPMNPPGDSPFPARSKPVSGLAMLAPRALGGYAVAAVGLAIRQVQPLKGLLLALACAVALVTAALWMLSTATATPMALLTRDPAATMGAKFYIGVLSSIGAVLWASASAVCWFGAMALRGEPRQRERRRYLLGAALLTAALGADDLFMLHEVVYPKLFALEEHWLMLLYGVALAALLLRFRAVVLASEVLLLILAILLFVLSVLVDGLTRDASALEDIFKVAGVACWLTYFWRVALAALSARRITDPGLEESREHDESDLR